MNNSGQKSSTLDLVAAAGSTLTPTERRIAEAVLAEPTLLAFGTVSDLARRVGTSRPSIVRFATKLGFEGYSELQQKVRGDMSHRLTRPSERIRSRGDSVVPARIAITDALDAVFDVHEGGRLAELVDAVVGARKIWVLSGETSQAGAHALHSGLSMVRSGVRALDEYSFGTDLSDAGAGDVAVVFDFHRYRRQVAVATRALAKAGVTVLAVTDSPFSPLVEPADSWIQIEVPAVGPFDSSVPVVALCELLIAEVANAIAADATDRIDRIEALWDKTEAFL
jgi:DNA-binding MurR/RpiR family transcriptional regulator